MSTYTRPYSETSGSIAYASAVNRYVDDFASTINNLNSDNLVASSVGATELEARSVNADKIDGEIRFYHEVFT